MVVGPPLPPDSTTMCLGVLHVTRATCDESARVARDGDGALAPVNTRNRMSALKEKDKERLQKLSSSFAASRLSSIRTLTRTHDDDPALAGMKSIRMQRPDKPLGTTHTVGPSTESHSLPHHVKSESVFESRPAPVARRKVTGLRPDISGIPIRPSKVPRERLVMRQSSDSAAAPDSSQIREAAIKVESASGSFEPLLAPTSAPSGNVGVRPNVNSARVSGPVKSQLTASASESPDKQVRDPPQARTTTLLQTEDRQKATADVPAKKCFCSLHWPRQSGMVTVLIVTIAGCIVMLSIRALTDWQIRNYMASNAFDASGDMKPWMKTYNRHIVRDLERLKLV